MKSFINNGFSSNESLNSKKKERDNRNANQDNLEPWDDRYIGGATGELNKTLYLNDAMDDPLVSNRSSYENDF